MFSPEHAIWRLANGIGELDRLLPYAESLCRKWAASDEVKFEGTGDVILAASLLIDNLLPDAAKAAFVRLMIHIICEARTNKRKLKSLHFQPRKRPGRKADYSKSARRNREVEMLIDSGKSASCAYEEVAKKHSTSKDTIRRAFERHKRAKRSGGLDSARPKRRA